MHHCWHIGIEEFWQQWASLPCIPWEDVLVVSLLLTSVSCKHMITLCKLLSLHFSIRLQAFPQRQTREREIGQGPCYLPVKHQQTVVVQQLPSRFLGQQQDLSRSGHWPLQTGGELRISLVCQEGGHDWPWHRLWQGQQMWHIRGGCGSSAWWVVFSRQTGHLCIPVLACHQIGIGYHAFQVAWTLCHSWQSWRFLSTHPSTSHLAICLDQRGLCFLGWERMTSVPLFMVGIAKEEVIDMFVDLT